MPIVQARVLSGDGKPSAPALSGDGKGGSKPISEVTGGARYIYYRLYMKDGPLESNNPIYSNDRFVSRVSSRSMRPPHTTALLKKYISKIEGLQTACENSTLYHSLSEQTASEDSTRFSFRGTSGPGLSDLNPIAIVIDATTVETRLQATSTVEPQGLSQRDYEQCYLYYLVYEDDCEVVSKTSFAENYPSLGRINTLSVPPPHTVASLKCHFLKSEEIMGRNAQLFEDEHSESPMDDSDAIAFCSETFSGSIADQPIAVAYESQGSVSLVDKEDSNQIQARELREARSAMEGLQKSHARELARVREELEKARETLVRERREAKSELDRLKEELKKSKEAHTPMPQEAQLSPALIQALSERPSFTKKLKARKDDDTRSDPAWHSMVAGEVFYTDGISRMEKYRQSKSWIGSMPCYLAISSSGKLAFVWPGCADFC